MKIKFLILLSVLSGLLLAAAWPENGFTPLIFVALVPLFFVQQYVGDNNKRGMYWYSWLAFLIWNVLTTWWVWYSTPIGSVAAFLLNSLFLAVVFQLFHISKKGFFENKKGTWILIFYWMTWEYFHLNWDLSWSWLNLGNVFASTPKWIQWYEYTGTFGGTLWILIVNVLVFNIVKKAIEMRCEKSTKFVVAFLVLILALPLSYSYYVYNNYLEEKNPVEVVVVQPNIDPYNEQYDLSPDSILSRNLALAETLITENTKYIVMPESALQENIWEGAMNNSSSIGRLHKFTKEHPYLSVITGATTYKLLKSGDKKTNAARKFSNVDKYYYAYNTALLIDNTGFIQIHHKSKLTPGVEVMPSWGILKPIEGLAIDLGGTVGTLARDEQPLVFSDKNEIGSSPIICYESVYGEFVAKTINKGGQIIFVITNDGWWGNTPGHRQHLSFSVLRAIETRRYVARSANTGISAFVNQRGDIQQPTKYWEPAVIKQNVNANTELTYYVKNGDYLATTSAFISALVLLISFTQGFLRKRKRK